MPVFCMKKFVIESRIKPPVDILNELDFVDTYSSCEGHYHERDPQHHRANVLFWLNGRHSEGAVEDFARFVLARTCEGWSERHVELLKHYVMMPGYDELETQYELRITPFSQLAPADVRREQTDDGIACCVEAVRKYIVSKRRPH
jgi:hypothetical protein